MEPNRHATEPFPRDSRRAVLARSYSCLISLLPLLFLAGCKPDKRYDLIEAELRTRDRELADTRAALEQARNLNRAYAQQSAVAAEPAPSAATPVYIPVKDITLGRGTGGMAPERGACDEGLMVVVVPHDEDGAAVKVPARLEIAAWDVSPAGLKTPIGNWAIPPEKLRPSWRGGLFNTGYFTVVPWQTRPTTERVRIAVRLTTLDGRAFEADKDVYVNVTPKVDAPPPMVVPSVVPAPPQQRIPLLPDPLPPGTEELPPPASSTGRGAKLMPPEGK